MVFKLFQSLFSKRRSTQKTSPSTDRQYGEIIHFNRSRGYGFIKSASLSDKVFVHISEISGRVRVGAHAYFDVVVEDEKGWRATNVEFAKEDG